LSKGQFCVHISDGGGESMASYSSVETTGFFDDAIDALAYVRFAEVPRILDIDVGTNREHFEVADAYVLRCAPEVMFRVDHLLGLLDRALISGSVSTAELASIRDDFNAAFSSTNPEVQILALGSITETLKSDYFRELFEEDLEEESDEAKKPSTRLKALLDSGRFSDNNKTHLSLARSFFKRHMHA
jgi:hypothetical protein